MMNIKYMIEAIKEAKKGTKYDEVPVGAVIVKDDVIIARAHNKKEEKKCANFHAEMVAIEKACKKINDWRLVGCDIYVTLEPCAMCTGALINARVDNIYFGAYDEKIEVTFKKDKVDKIVWTMEFKDEETAVAAGYRPCGVCMKEAYKKWKEQKQTE